MSASSRASRRRFLARVSALGVAGAAAPLALGLDAMAALAAPQAADFKALVCVFLYGGNDPFNTIVPADVDGHRRYRASRADIAWPREALRASRLVPRQASASAELALAPPLLPLKALFDAGRLAVMLNVGPLVVPTSKKQYLAASVPLPPKLFSHNDQQAYWQALADEGAASGWAGRMVDMLHGGGQASVFTNVTASENAIWLAGRHSGGYRVGPAGSTPIALLSQDLYGSAACTALLRSLITERQPHWIADHHAALVARSISADLQLRAALDGVPAPAGLEGPLGSQLAVVARMLAARQALGVKRQVFFVSLNGFDNHDGMRANHPGLLSQLGTSLAAFQSALDRSGLARQVVTFTASEFGRTLVSNGDGSDHGWGGHHLMMGGSVRGGRWFGEHPEIDLGGDGFVDHGRMLPSTSIDQFAATLGAWFGVAPVDLKRVLPNLAAFDRRPLGFL